MEKSGLSSLGQFMEQNSLVDKFSTAVRLTVLSLSN